MPKRILILHTSIGLGHKSIAENIGAALASNGYEVRLEDILQVQKGKLVNFGTTLYRIINVHLPWLWSWLYKSTDHGILFHLTLPLRVPLASKHHKKLLQIIQEFKPDLIISAQITATLPGRGQAKGAHGSGNVKNMN